MTITKVNSGRLFFYFFRLNPEFCAPLLLCVHSWLGNDENQKVTFLEWFPLLFFETRSSPQRLIMLNLLIENRRLERELSNVIKKKCQYGVKGNLSSAGVNRN